VDAGQKGREVMQLLYGADIYDRAVDYYQPFRQYLDFSMHDNISSADTLPAIRHE